MAVDFLNSLRHINRSEFDSDGLDDDISVISSDILKDLATDQNLNSEDKLRDILLDIVYALELLNNKTNANKSLLVKLDSLTATMQDGNSRLEALQQTHISNVDEDVGNLIDRKRDLEWQYMRSEKLSSFYEELLSRDNERYVPFEFRMKVRSDISAYEKRIKEEKSVNNFKVEIQLMKETMETCRRQLDHINLEINSYLASPTLQKVMKEDHQRKMQQNGESSKKRLDAVLKKVKKRFEKDVNSGAKQYLLRFLDKENLPHVSLDQRYLRKSKKEK